VKPATHQSAIYHRVKHTITSLTALLFAPLAMLHSVGAPESQLQPASPAQGRPSRPSVGAIRWDAWSGGRVTEEVQRTLGPAKYHDRLPWFAEVKGDNQVRIDGSQRGIMDREINFAADAGLDYWAFLLYPESDAMSLALQQYLKSPQRQRLNFCVILHNSFGVPEAAWPRERARLISLLKEPGYQTVLGGRPLVFEFQARLGGKFPRQRFADFRQAAREAGLNPYCVFMGWDPAADFHRESTNGFDAVSAYASGSDAASYADLVRQVETGYWLNAAEAKVPYVPLVTTGWDKQPRKDHPVSWEKDHSYHRQAVFPARATPAEIASHLQRALTFVREHQDICAANTSIIYAWNEHDEGGWLSPTWALGGQPNTSRLDAIREVLSARKASQNPAESVPKPISPRPAKVTVGPRELIRARDNMPFVMDSTHGDELVLCWRRGEAASALVGRRDSLRAAHPGRRGTRTVDALFHVSDSRRGSPHRRHERGRGRVFPPDQSQERDELQRQFALAKKDHRQPPAVPIRRRP